jgi:hypothetical protein
VIVDVADPMYGVVVPLKSHASFGKGIARFGAGAP